MIPCRTQPHLRTVFTGVLHFGEPDKVLASVIASTRSITGAVGPFSKKNPEWCTHSGFTRILVRQAFGLSQSGKLHRKYTANDGIKPPEAIPFKDNFQVLTVY